VKHVRRPAINDEPSAQTGDETPSERFPVVTVIGVGLLGGSVALGLRGRGLVGRVVGVGRRTESLERALRLGIIDEFTLDIEDGIGRADLVVIATPAEAACDIVRRIGPRVGPRAVVTDVASTKTAVVQAAGATWPAPVRFVGSHPIAGSHQKGPEHARADLFESVTVVLTPDDTTDPQSTSEIERVWHDLGARSVTLSPEEHDGVLALTSHLPHLAASGLLCAAADARRDLTPFIGPGFTDTTRVAGGDPEMWRDICLTNKANILDVLDRFDRSMAQVRKAVEEADRDDLGRLFAQVQQLHREFRADYETS